MKKLTCKDLGGPCDAELSGATFEEMGKASRAHVVECISAGDEGHRAAAQKMMTASPEEQQAMMTEYEKRFNEAPEA